MTRHDIFPGAPNTGPCRRRPFNGVVAQPSPKLGCTQTVYTERKSDHVTNTVASSLTETPQVERELAGLETQCACTQLLDKAEYSRPRDCRWLSLFSETTRCLLAKIRASLPECYQHGQERQSIFSRTVIPKTTLFNCSSTARTTPRSRTLYRTAKTPCKL